MFAVVLEKSIWIQDSRDSGYSEEFREFIPMKDETELRSWILRNQNTKYTVVEYSNVEVEMNVSIKRKSP